MVQQSNNTQIVKEQSNEEFRILIERIENKEMKLSYSSIREFAKSPRHFIKHKLRKFEQTEAMKQGSLLDCLVTTPDAFEKDYVVSDASKPTGLGGALCDLLLGGTPIETAIREAGYKKAPTSKSLDACLSFVEFQQSNEGKIIVSQDDYDFAEAKKDALYKNYASKWVLDQVTHTQFKCEWNAHGYDWHGYGDMKGEGIMCDLKSMTQSVEPLKVKRHIRDMKYDWQAAMYLGSQTGNHSYYIMAIDNGLNICVIELSSDVIRYANERIRECMKSFKKCVLKTAWGASYDFHTPYGIYDYDEI